MAHVSVDDARTFCRLKRLRRGLTCLGIALTCVAPRASATEEVQGPVESLGFSEVIGAALDLPLAPVLTASAGVLPTSPFWVLDRTDEWLQRNVFSFGIPRLRALSALAHASERVAELQVLDTDWLRTPDITQASLEEIVTLLEFAARTAGDELRVGGRPVLLVTHVVRTTHAALDALEGLVQWDEDLALLDLEEGAEVLPGTVVEPEPPAHEVLLAVQAIVREALLPNPASVPEQILRIIALEDLSRAHRSLERSPIGAASDGGRAPSRDEPSAEAAGALAQARALILQGESRGALPIIDEAILLGARARGGGGPPGARGSP